MTRAAPWAMAVLALAVGGLAAQDAPASDDAGVAPPRPAVPGPGAPGSGEPPGAIPFAQWNAPDPLAGEALCGACQTSGRLPYELADAWLDVLEPRATAAGTTWRVLFDSELIESDNHGLDWTPCTRQRAPSIHDLAAAQYAEELARREAWLARRREIDAEVGAEEPLTHIESTHFVVAWGIPKIKTSDKRTWRQHDACLLYVTRLEELYAEFQTMFGIDDSMNQSSKHHLYIFDRLRDFREAGPRYTGLVGSTTVQRMAGVDQQSALASWFDKGTYPTEEDYYRHLAYSVVKHFTADLYDLRWFEPGEMGLVPPWLNDRYGWLDTGLCHWFELRLPGRVISYSMREQDTTSRWKGGDWHKNVYRAVRAGEVPSFAEVITRPTQSLTARENQFVWSWVDFLLDRDARAMGTALKLTKLERPTREILKECWGISALGFEEVWGAWVLEKYAPSQR